MLSSMSESQLASCTARTKTMRSLNTLRSNSRSAAPQSSLSFAWERNAANHSLVHSIPELQPTT